jgi:hypothetical protein
VASFRLKTSGSAIAPLDPLVVEYAATDSLEKAKAMAQNRIDLHR